MNKFEMYPIKDLYYADYNPRKISSEKLKQLTKTMLQDSNGEEGFLDQPIIINEITQPDDSVRYRVISGHQRLEAAKVLKWSKILCFKRKLPDIEEKSMNLNRNAQYGEWTHQSHIDLLLEIDSHNNDMDYTGHTRDEIDALINPSKPSDEINNKKQKLATCPECDTTFDVKTKEIVVNEDL
jgi:ParB-like chromosome segregation protein Spo0J